jgi:integrase
MPIRKRGDRWWIDFYYQGRRYRRPAGTSQKQAQAALDRIRGRIASGDFDPAQLKPEPEEEASAGTLFEVAADLYIEHRLAEGKKERSYLFLLPAGDPEKRRRRTSQPLRAAGAWRKAFEGRGLPSISSEEIEALLRTWTKERSWLPATRNCALMQLSGFLSYCIGRGWIEKHPTERGRVPLLALDNARERWFRPEEIDALVKAAGTKDEKKKDAAWAVPHILFAAMSGMRLGELCTLRRSSFQADSQGRKYLVTEKTKNGDRLYWPLEGEALTLVEERVKAAPFPSSYLFAGPRGGSAETKLRRVFPAIVRRAKLTYGRKDPDGATWHTFRHSMASIAINNGVPESEVQRLGNWKSRTMVARYAHLADETMRASAGKLASIISLAAHRSHAVVTTASEAAIAVER